MATPKTALSGSSKTPQILSEEQSSAFQDRVRESISRRAYEIYRDSGGIDGNDLQNWTQAENQILQRGLEVRESGSWLALNASIPDSLADEVEVCLTPNRVTVHAERRQTFQSDGAGMQGVVQREIFLTEDLNAEIEPSTASATLKDQKLTIMVKKRYPVSTSVGSPATASIASTSSKSESAKA